MTSRLGAWRCQPWRGARWLHGEKQVTEARALLLRSRGEAGRAVAHCAEPGTPVGEGRGLHHLSEDPSLPVPFLCSLSSKDRQVCGVENSTRNPLFLRRASRRGRDLPAFAAISGTPKNALQAESGSLECSL